jgi:hypothetical protein
MRSPAGIGLTAEAGGFARPNHRLTSVVTSWIDRGASFFPSAFGLTIILSGLLRRHRVTNQNALDKEDMRYRRTRKRDLGRLELTFETYPVPLVLGVVALIGPALSCLISSASIGVICGQNTFSSYNCSSFLTP